MCGEGGGGERGSNLYQHRNARNEITTVYTSSGIVMGGVHVEVQLCWNIPNNHAKATAEVSKRL